MVRLTWGNLGDTIDEGREMTFLNIKNLDQYKIFGVSKMQKIEELQSQLHILSVTHSTDLAKIRKQLQSILEYDLTIAMDMLQDGASSDRVHKHLQNIQETLLQVKQIGVTK